MNKIHILPEFIANQIAAGEVVQRPESVIKELVENSMDAGAKTIAIFIADAGKSLIHIVDDGMGMSREDLEVAPLRHSTSKIKTTDDLAAIKTFGFRGEALPSISSVALLEIRSKLHNAEQGWRLLSEPMKLPTIEQIQMDSGTQVFVRNLFYNVPARRKFLKSNMTEQKYIYETVQKFCLAHPNKRFIFYDNNSLVYDVKEETLLGRIANILRIGDEEHSLIAVDMSINDIRISGYIGHPQLAKKTNAAQYFFLNGRHINSKNLSYAVYSAYEQLIERNLKPFFVLNISLDYNQVDVNVHPQKSEVKFEDEKLIYSCVKNAAVEALRLHNLLPELVGDVPTSYEKVVTTDIAGVSETLLVDKITGEIYHTPQRVSGHSAEHNSINTFHYRPQNHAPSAVAAIHKIYESGMLGEEEVQKEEQIRLPELDGEYNLWQFHNKYIFVETADGLLVIDQHNAHERHLFERLMEKIRTGNSVKQTLLFPLELDLSSIQLLAVKELWSELDRMGFELETASEGTTITILTLPQDLEISQIERSFAEIIDDYLQNEELAGNSKQERIAATVACKAAIKAGRKLSQEEMRIIVNDLLRCRMQHICPHGRPIIYHSPLLEWDRRLGRR
ncbi:MAG: DNA mismatch repair endonuclease MutL [Ignavibacteria bacterium]|nr:DNA mismatch repair endonuclease MutL [Ignavibacteria bacterium]